MELALPPDCLCPVCCDPMIGYAEWDGRSAIEVCSEHHLMCYACARRVKLEGDARCPVCRKPMMQAFKHNASARRIISGIVTFLKEEHDAKKQTSPVRKGSSSQFNIVMDLQRIGSLHRRVETLEQNATQQLALQLRQLQARMLDMEEHRSLVNEQLSEMAVHAFQPFRPNRTNAASPERSSNADNETGVESDSEGESNYRRISMEEFENSVLANDDYREEFVPPPELHQPVPDPPPAIPGPSRGPMRTFARRNRNNRSNPVRLVRMQTRQR